MQNRNTQNEKRSVRVNGKKTSISLEEPFWEVFKEMVRESRMSRNQYISNLADQIAPECNLSSTIRLTVLEHCKRQAESLEHPQLAAE